MRSTGSGPLGALLMLAPLIAVPILAVVGIPQFAPGNLLDPNSSNSRSAPRERRVPDEPGFGDDARPDDADDLFGPLDKSKIGNGRFKDPLSPRTSKGRGRRRSDDLDDNPDEEFNPFDEEKKSVDQAETNPLDVDPGEFESDSEPEEGAPQRSPQRKPAAEKFADESFGGDSASDGGIYSPGTEGNSKSRRPSRNPANEGQGFEEEPENVEPPRSPSGRNSRPNPKAKNTPRDPDDAPEYVPNGSTDNGVDGAAFSEEAVDPPEPKASGTRGRGPGRSEPAEPSDESAPQAPETEQPADAPPHLPRVDELTWQTATKRLRALGVGKSKQHFTYIEDRNLFLFTCTAIHREDSARTQRFQAEAEEPLLAVRQVLEKLEEWQEAQLKTRPRTAQRAKL